MGNEEAKHTTPTTTKRKDNERENLINRETLSSEML